MNEQANFTVSPENSGGRIDKYIADRLGRDYSRTYVRYLMDNGFVLVNGKSVKPRYTPKAGDKVSLTLAPLPKDEAMEPEDIPLDIVHEDEDIIVVNKPPGMVVHPAAGNWHGTLVNALLFHCGKLAETDDQLRPGIVHRLDKDTSGIIVAVKNDRAKRSLTKQFQNRTVKKKYIALVKGYVEMDNGLVDEPIGRHPTHRLKMAAGVDNGKPARTVYHVIKRYGSFTQLEVRPETGRMHQIRVHMKHIGYPVLGDRLYGNDRSFWRQALHAEMIAFTHPGTGEHVEYHAPFPDDIKLFIEKEGEDG
ncbi:MAG: RluA family pseudouridine synthase [Candidatus Omnitrophica bacterium]|nr:RluA family pseudouridine synthase [Candidatus Omnitrophota bacterium]